MNDRIADDPRHLAVCRQFPRKGQVAAYREAVDHVERPERDPRLRKLRAHVGLRRSGAPCERLVNAASARGTLSGGGESGIEGFGVVEQNGTNLRSPVLR